jgi:hypothetical protein
MKRLLIYTTLLSILITGCYKEGDLKPSKSDINRVKELLDEDKPLIKKWYDTYNTAVLYEYSDSLDYIYTAGTQGGINIQVRVNLPQIKSLFINEDGELPTDSVANYNSYVDKALVFLDTSLFNYLDADKIANMMPPTLLISSSLSTHNQQTISGLKVHFQGDYSMSSSTKNNFHSLFNNHSMVFNVNQENLQAGAENYFRDNFYLFICKLLEQNDLYDLFDNDIYKFSEPYLNQNILDTYKADFGEDIEEWTDLTPKGKIKTEWFLSKGFVDAEGFNEGLFRTETVPLLDEDGNYIIAESGDSVTTYVKVDGSWKKVKAEKVGYLNIDEDNEKGDSTTFLEDKENFIRSYINQILYRSYDELNAYPANIKTGLKITATTLIDWGIDIVSFNPELEQFLNQ